LIFLNKFFNFIQKMKKKVKFYNYHEDNKICEGVLEEDSMFAGGYKVIYKNMIFSIGSIKIVKDE